MSSVETPDNKLIQVDSQKLYRVKVKNALLLSQDMIRSAGKTRKVAKAFLLTSPAVPTISGAVSTISVNSIRDVQTK